MPRVKSGKRISTTLPNHVADARVKANITQAALAEQIGISRGGVASYESGLILPSFMVLESLCEALLCSPDDLYEKVLLNMIVDGR